MAAPPSAGTTSFKQTGYTQLWWGTEALPLGNYIVVSARPKQRADTIRTEQGSGLTAVISQVVDGSDFEITVEEDLTITPPHVGSVVTLENIFVSGAALGNTIPPFGNTAITNGSFLIINNDFNAERKAVGQRVLLAQSFVAVTGVTGGGNPVI
jgi:hypothetical protein